MSPSRRPYHPTRPFGTPNGASGTEKVKFAGEILDSSTSLYYIFARYYDPELGRWLSLDPKLGRLSVPQTQNRYVYCANNPLGLVDPSGMGSFWHWLLGSNSGPNWWMDPSNPPSKENAEIFANEIESTFKRRLDFTTSSLNELDSLIDEGWDREGPEQLDPVIESFGSFLGEALISIYGGSWVYGEAFSEPAVEINDHLIANPFVKIRKRFVNGKGDSISFFFKVLDREIRKGQG